MSRHTSPFPVWFFCVPQRSFFGSALPTVRTAADIFQQMQSTALTAEKEPNRRISQWKKLFIFILIALSFACLVLAPQNRQSVPVENSLLEEIRSAPVVKLEYADQTDHQPIFVDNAGSTASIADMDIQSSQDGFNEEWLYRFTCNPREKVRSGQEIVVLLGSTSMEIDGTTYTPGDGVSYDVILDWAEGVYDFYQAD